MPRVLRVAAWAVFGFGVVVYAAAWTVVWQGAREALANPPQRAADAALVLGNRAYLRGKPNPCLTGRVDEGVALARAGLARELLFSGGVDSEDGRIEAEVMEQHARAVGHGGPMRQERVSSSTRLNLALSTPMLQAAGVRSVIVVSEPYHLWRVKRLARNSGFDRAFDVQYAAAPSSCWRRWGMVFKGALREPLAVVNNAAHGYLF
ncbi:YdcF family protein [Variovorax sp. UC122_21]|uniref:YdcF family protein n=1 Tax=Variovorax sp. UC122_21 TaxID=3374554 RepID=UPI00375743EB